MRSRSPTYSRLGDWSTSLRKSLFRFSNRPDALPLGGRFAFTVEEGVPLSAAERAVMPAPDDLPPDGPGALAE